MEPLAPRRPPLIPWLAYNAVALPLWWTGLHLARFFDAKAEAALSGRAHLFDRLHHQREKLRGCLWFHASSAGEVEQCRPVLRALRDSRLRDRPTLLTVFSPSGHAHAVDHAEADYIEYLPLDTLRASDRILHWLEPSALIYLRYDAWPNLVWTAHAARVPLFLISATLGVESRRHHRALHSFFRTVYRSFDGIGCLSEEDQAAFAELYGLSSPRLQVTGDPRFDQVLDRAAQAATDPRVRLLQAQPWRYLALGSTWPADDRVILPALREELEAHPQRGVLWIPHEPTPTALRRVERGLQAQGIASRRWSELVELPTGRRRSTAAARDCQQWRVIVVDAVGILAELYHAAEVAYVGGGFGWGVHNVLEAAAAGIGVLFGPRHRRSQEAAQLLQRGGGISVRDSRELRLALRDWGNDSTRRRAGEAARLFLLDHRGAAEKNLSLVESVLLP